jgi:hypothetical protein
VSSDVYLEFAPPIELAQWQTFCAEQEIEYHRNVIGRNFWYGGKSGQVQIRFGEAVRDANEPPSSAYNLVVGSYFGSNINDIADVAAEIIRRWPHAKWDCDPELKRPMNYRVRVTE